jgi:hypothetical protein
MDAARVASERSLGISTAGSSLSDLESRDNRNVAQVSALV